ncbi:hypothetical protein [Bradyrhizobium sp. USDA 4502]
MPDSQSIVFTKFTEEQWQAVRAVRATWPDNIDWTEARRALESAGHEYSEIENLREQRRRSGEYKETLDTAERNLRSFRAALSRLESLSPSGDDLNGLPDPGRYEARLKHLRVQYNIWSAPFSGRNNQIRDTLRDQLLSIWEIKLHGRLGSSKNKFDEPIGPLIRFLEVTLTAIMGEPPSPYTLRDIINRAKKLRDRRASKKRKPARTLRRKVKES